MMRKIFLNFIIFALPTTSFILPSFAAQNVNIEDVAVEFLNNPIRAQQRYLNQEVTAEGRVERITQENNGSGFIVYVNGSSNFYFESHLDSSALNTAANLSNGQTIRIRGTITDFYQQNMGFLVTRNMVTLKNCFIDHIFTNDELEERSLRRDAENGHAASQNNLGVLYAKRDNYTEAVKWYRLAAEKGIREAQNNLGSCYENGEGVEQDYKLAVDWYKKAAETNYPNAQNNLGRMYENGLGVDKDLNQAVSYYYKAASGNNENGLKNLKRLADGGNPWAQNDLGVFYANKHNYTEAFKYYLKAAEQGHLIAQSNLGFLYYHAQGVNKSDYEAAKWFKKSAEQGYAKAQAQLGLMYRRGWGLKKDYVEALKWYGKAAEQGEKSDNFIYTDINRDAAEGDASAQAVVAMIYAGGEKPDMRKALEYATKSANQNYAPGQFALGLVYCTGGDGVKQDTKKGIELMEKSVQNGFEEGREVLEKLKAAVNNSSSSVPDAP